MRKDVKIDQREIRCPNAAFLGSPASNRGFAKPGDCILYNEEWDNITGPVQSRVRLARVLGRVSAPALGSGAERTPEVKGWALVMAMSEDHRSVYERWVDPQDIRQVFDPSPKLAAFFNSPVVSADVRDALASNELSEGNLSYAYDGVFRVRLDERGAHDVPIGDDGRAAATEDLALAARLVLQRWEHGDLAAAVRELDAAVRNFEAGPPQFSRPSRQTLSDGTRLVEWKNFDGRLHRESGPAVEGSDGLKEWYRDGKHHRDDGPAVELPAGSRYWYRDGIQHREGGPAVELSDGRKEWFQNGVRHREDGPAIEPASGQSEYYLIGRQIDPELYEEAVRNLDWFVAQANRRASADVSESAEEVRFAHDVLRKEFERFKAQPGYNPMKRDDRTADPEAALRCRSEEEAQALAKRIGWSVEDMTAYEDMDGGKSFVFAFKYEAQPYLTAPGYIQEMGKVNIRESLELRKVMKAAEHSPALAQDDDEEEVTHGMSR